MTEIKIKGHIRCIRHNNDDPFILYQDAKLSKGKLCEIIAQAIQEYILSIIPEEVDENPQPKENYNYADRSLLRGYNQAIAELKEKLK